MSYPFVAKYTCTPDVRFSQSSERSVIFQGGPHLEIFRGLRERPHSYNRQTATYATARIFYACTFLAHQYVCAFNSVHGTTYNHRWKYSKATNACEPNPCRKDPCDNAFIICLLREKLSELMIQSPLLIISKIISTRGVPQFSRLIAKSARSERRMKDGNLWVKSLRPRMFVTWNAA